MPKFRVRIMIPDLKHDETVAVEAKDEWKAAAMAMFLCTATLRGQHVDYEVTLLPADADVVTAEDIVAAVREGRQLATAINRINALVAARSALSDFIRLAGALEDCSRLVNDLRTLDSAYRDEIRALERAGDNT